MHTILFYLPAAMCIRKSIILSQCKSSYHLLALSATPLFDDISKYADQLKRWLLTSCGI